MGSPLWEGCDGSTASLHQARRPSRGHALAAIATGHADVVVPLDEVAVALVDVAEGEPMTGRKGGVRDSGNTREGPAYAVLEMTEVRSAVLS